MNKKYLIFGIFAIVLVVAGFIIAESPNDLQNELNKLTNDLNSQGYDWLVNYSGEIPEDSCQYISSIENISSENLYRTYLTGLGECYDNETQILTENDWKYFYDLNDNEKVATLNPETKEMEWQIPLEQQEFDYNNEMYKIILEDGSDLLVSPEHKVYSLSYLNKLSGYDINLNTEIINNRPLNSDDLTCLSNFNNSEKVVSISGGEILSTTIPEDSFGGNNCLLRKCLSNVNITLDSDLAILNTCLSEESNGTFLMSYPCSFNNSSILHGKFSSERNFSLLEESMFLFSNEFRNICHNRKNSGFCEMRKIILKNLINADSCSEQLQNLPDHDSCSFENRSSITDFSVCNDIIINVNSHEQGISDEIFKSFALQPITEVYSEINSGKEIYFLNSENKPVKVSSIKKENYNGKIYDVDVENDIVLVRRNNKKDNAGSDNNQLINKSGDNNLLEENPDHVGFGVINFEASGEANLNEKRNYMGVDGNLIDVTGAVWSGNSNPHNIFDLKILGDAVEFDWVVDPLFINSTSSNPYNITLTNTTSETNFTHLNLSDPNIVLYMPFDYPKYNASWVAGKFGSALDLNYSNSDGIVSTFSLNSSTNSTTYSFWINASTTAMSSTFFNDGSQGGSPYIWFYQSSGGTLTFSYWNGTTGGGYQNYLTCASCFNSTYLKNWTHIVLVVDYIAGQGTYYFNGVNRTTQTATYPMIFPNTNRAKYIGSYQGLTANNLINGKIDEFKIYNRTITQSEIDNLYANNSILNSTDLLVSYGLDDNTGFNVQDSAGNKSGYIFGYTLKSYDYSNNSKDGTNSYGASYTDNGVYGGAMTFDGVNDYISITSTTLSKNHSLFAWVTSSGISNNFRMGIFSSYNLQLIPSTRFLDFHDGSYKTSNTTILPNTWAFVGIVIDNSTGNYIFYINGTQAGTGTVNFGSTTLGTISTLGSYSTTSYFMNGSIDEVLIYNRSLSQEEVSAIYNNQSARFFPTGEMLFQNLNFSTNNTVNITLQDCQTNMGGKLRAKINLGSWSNFSSCSLNNYQIYGNLTNANLTIGFIAGNESNNTFFYSPLVIGNITLNDYTNSSFDGQEPSVTINSPTNNYFNSASVLFNVTATDSSNISACWYSIGGANISMTNLSTQHFNATNSSVPAGTYTAQFWCNDTFNNINSTQTVAFWIDLTQPTISFETPTPENNSYVSSTTQTIVANISDSSNSNSSSFIDFDRSLVGWWEMDYYNSTGIFDNSTYSNFGKFTGTGFSSSNISQGARGQGLTFDGNDDYIDCGTTSVWNNFTISLWVNGKNFTSGPGPYQWFFDKAPLGQTDTFGIGVGVSNKHLMTFTKSNYKDTGIVLSEDVWTHIVWVKNSTNHSLIYVGGNLVYSYFGANVSSGPARSVYLGVYGSGSFYFFNGSLDEVMIFNRSLSSTEILALYNSKENKFNSTFSSLATGQHNYTLYGIDEAGNLNQSTRNFINDAVAPSLSFVEPSPANGNTTSNTSIYVNVSVSDVSNVSSWIDWNRGLVGWWEMDYYNSTGIYDNSTYSNFGTFAGTGFSSSNISQGARGQGLKFDGVDDYVSVADSNSLSFGNGTTDTPFSISAWVKPSIVSGTYDIVSKYTASPGTREYQLFISASDLYFHIWDDNNSAYMRQRTPGDLSAYVGKWVHFVGTYNGSSTTGGMKIYINGDLSSTTGSSSGTYIAMENLGTVVKIGLSQGYFNGSIDEVLIFNRSLSSTEILALYGNSSSRYFGANFTNLSSGNYTFKAYAVDQAGNVNITENRTVIIQSNPPNAPANVSWITTGGLTNSSLNYLQIMDYINATCTSPTGVSLLGCNITIARPDGTLQANNSAMNNFTNDVWNYTTDFELNQAGTWIINVSAWNSAGSNVTSSNFSVSTANLSTTDGWYGCSNGTVPTSTLISTYIGYGCNLIEFNSSISNMSTAWGSILTSINNSKNSNMKVGLNFVLDFNYTNATQLSNAGNNISNYFPNLTIANYQIAIEYISFELVNAGSYNLTQKDNAINNLSQIATLAIDNNFVIYSKNYNSTGIDNAYSQYTKMLYLDNSTLETWIQQENNLMRTQTSLNRIYVGLNSTIMNSVQNFQDNIIDRLRAKPISPSITDTRVAQLSNYDVVVFNNQSSAQIFATNISQNTGVSGKDVWDDTHKLIMEKNTDLNFSVNVSAYSATMLIFEDLDHIQMTSDSSGTLYKQSASVQRNFSYTDDVNDGNWLIDNYQDEIRWEGFDPFYKSNSFMLYYGWLNVSYVNNWSAYSIAVLADKNTGEIATVLANSNTIQLYFYISVADYENTDSWVNSKKSEVDSILALNSSTRINIFLDGLDSGIGGTNFSTRFKDVVDYVKVTKGRKLGLNTYTAYEDFCTWSQPDGFCLKESCARRWNGADAGNPTNYSWENWTLEMEKSSWYNSHNIDILCQAFDNRTSDTYEPLNWTIVQDTHFASLVLGYNDFYISQPDFNYAHTIYNYDAGEDMAQSYSTNDNETYYRRYSNGIVYFNTSSGTGWIDDGREADVQVCFKLYDSSDGPGDDEMSWEFRINNVSTNNVYSYNIPGSTITAGVWQWYCTTLNSTHESDTGSYKIEATTTDSGTAADGIFVGWASVANTGKHSWWSNTAGDPVWNIYSADQNWEVKIIVNESKKASVDFMSNVITQTNTTFDGYTNLTISSSNSYDLEVWSNPIYVLNYSALEYWNGTEFIVMNPGSSLTCDSNNPNWASDSIGGETFKSCYYNSGASTAVRVAPPSLSTKEFRITVNDTSSPRINFTTGTENNGTIFSRNWVFANVSVIENNEGNITFSLYNNSGIVNSTIRSYTNGTENINWTGLAEGVYYYNVSVNDTNGNLNYTETRKITLDTTTPSLIINYPANTTYNTSITQLNYTITETNPDKCWYSNNSGTTNSSAVSNGTNFTIVTVENLNTFILYCNDSANNVNSSSITFLIDTTFPQIDFTSGTQSNDSNIAQNYVFANVSVTEANEDKIVFSLYNSSQLVNSTISNAGTRTINWTGLAEGIYYYNVSVNDTAGNINTSETRKITLDMSKPFIEFISPTPENGERINNNFTTINTTINDTYSETSAWIDWNKNLVGYWSFDYYNSTGVFDNSTYSNFGSFSRNDANITNIMGGNKRGMALELDGEWSDEFENYDYVVVEEGVDLNEVDLDPSNAMTISAWINAKSWENPNSAPIVDKYYGGVAPPNQKSYFLWADTDGSGGELRFGIGDNDGDAYQLNVITSSANMSLNQWYHVAVTWDKNNGSGLFYLNGSLLQVLGGGANSSQYQSNIDLQIGASFLNQFPSPDLFNGTIDEVMIFNRSLSANEIASLYNNTANRLYNNFTGLSDKTYNYSVYAIDNAGNLNITLDRQVIVDTVSPQVELISPTSTTYTSDSLSINVNTNENSTCNYSINAGTTNYSLTSNSTGTGHTATKTLSNANYGLNIYCSDLAGNQNNSQNVLFTITVPSEEIVTPGTGGGGGGGQIYKPKTSFELSRESYEKTISIYSINFDIITIENTGDLKEEYDIKVETINDVISFEEKKIKLSPNESKNIEFKISAPKKTGIYTGKIIISCGSLVKEVLVVINVNTEKSLFDIGILMPNSMKILNLGQNLRVEFNLLQMGIKEKIDVTVNYVIKDFSGNIYLTESETLAVYDKKIFEKEFYTEELPSGNYVLGAELVYPEGVAVASSQFSVSEKPGFSVDKFLIGLIFITMICIVAGIIFAIKKYKRTERHLRLLRTKYK